MDIKFFIGPMSKNVVDSIINFQKKYSKKIALIPSRRQIDFKGGYSNNWTIESLSKYAKNLFQRYWELCYQSKKWVKWVKNDFNPVEEKENLIKVRGHYILSNQDFVNDIKSEFPYIDLLIQKNIEKKLVSLHLK